MPTELREHQLEMLNLAETRSLLFGTEDTGYLTLTPPQWKAGEAKDDDLARPHEDGRYFGSDLRGGGQCSLEIGVLTDRLTDPGTTAYERDSDYVDQLQTWWDDEDFRTSPTDLAVLRACVAGRTWRAYGRPRRFDAVKSRLAQMGYTPVVCDFAIIDNRVYADTPSQQVMPLVGAPTGGFVAPFTAPITMTAETQNTDTITIGGGKKTWLWATFSGPVLNPKVTLMPVDHPQDPTLTIGLTASIADDFSVTVDPRPWSRGVTRQDGANLAGALSYDTPILRSMLLRPGRYVVAYNGTDASGTSTCTLNWREARSQP